MTGLARWSGWLALVGAVVFAAGVEYLTRPERLEGRREAAVRFYRYAWRVLMGTAFAVCLVALILAMWLLRLTDWGSN